MRPNRGIRTEQYKLIHYVMEPQEFEMYDLGADPGETKNLYGDSPHAETQKKLWSRLQELQARIPQRPKIEQKTAAS